MDADEDDEDDTASTPPNSSATGLILIGIVGILVIVGFLYSVMSR